MWEDGAHPGFFLLPQSLYPQPPVSTEASATPPALQKPSVQGKEGGMETTSIHSIFHFSGIWWSICKQLLEVLAQLVTNRVGKCVCWSGQQAKASGICFKLY